MSHSLRVSRTHLAAVTDALLWRGLAFARAQEVRSPAVAGLLRRGILVLWWAATFQLHIHARYWLRAPSPAQHTSRPPGAMTAPVDPATLILPRAAAPVVSIIIPSYGQVRYTLGCLASIA